MPKDIERLKQLLSPAITHLGCEFWGCQYLSQGSYSVLRVYIDKVGGVTLDDCQRASEQISAVLDVDDPMSGRYTLEVSSPGIDRPLFTLEQYQQFIGKQISIRLHAPLEKRRNFKGALQKAEHEQITVEVEGKMINVPFVNIEKANAVPEW